MVHKRDGHIWDSGFTGDRCRFCGIRIEKYHEILQGIKNNPDDLRYVEMAVCPSIISRHFVGKCPTCGKEYDFLMPKHGETCHWVHCECNTVFLLT